MSKFSNKRTFGPANEIFDREVNPVIRTEEAAADQGKLALGLLVALEGGKIVPYKKDHSESVGTGDDSTVTFLGTLSHIPIQPGSLSLTDGSQTVTADVNGNLVGDGSGRVDPVSGEFEVTFDAAPADEADISAVYANKLHGLLTHDCYTSDDDLSARVMRAGSPFKEYLLVGAVATGAADFAALEVLGIWPK